MLVFLLYHVPCSAPNNNLTEVHVSARGGRFDLPELDRLGAQFIVGMSTVSRHRTNYLNRTLHSLQCALKSDGAQPTVLVLNGDIPPNKHTEFENLWKQPFIREFSRQGLTLIHVGELHKELQAAKAARSLPQTLGDPPQRIWWRCKENPDKAYLIEAAVNVSQGEKYYLQLEDDVKLAPYFLSKLSTFITNLDREGKAVDIVSLFGHKGSTGGVAIVYRIGFLQEYVAYLRANFYQSPYDWMLDHFVSQHGFSTYVMIPNLVQHTGIMSSLAGKVQLITSSTFIDTGVC